MATYLADAAPPICQLNVKAAFLGLTEKEKLYSHHMSRASWGGARIVMAQTSKHSSDLYDLLIATFSAVPLPNLLASSRVTAAEFNSILSYSAQVFSNLGNFKSFGGSKFVPNVSPAVFEAVVRASGTPALTLWDAVKHDVFSTAPEASTSIGKRSEGHISNYYLGLAPTDEEVDLIQSLADAAGVSTLNTRLTKKSATEFTLHIASASTTLPTSYPATLSSGKMTCDLQGGDFSSALTSTNDALKEAIKYAANQNQAGMLVDYSRCFETGDIEAHKDGSRKWVKDVAPAVETYIGHIEAYQDPYGTRAEWEGFVAVVNKAESLKFAALVDAAPAFVKTLPWGPDFELAKFIRPDFTALEILSFATGGIPAGINIPNYHDVREQDGFKNVSLSNILAAKSPNEEMTFIAPEEVEAYDKWQGVAFDVQVANHELLGHGTGKLLTENSDGTFNFSRDLINPLTGTVVDSWYKAGETYGSRFGSCAASLEECRAEAVALYLASNRDILKIFGFETDEDAEKLTYYTFLSMARAGVRALEWYDAKTGNHGQAHMQARLGITQFLIEAGIVTIEEQRTDNVLTDAYVRVDAQQCKERGKEVMGALLMEIQIRKSTGDGKSAAEFYTKLTTPSTQWIEELLPLVIAKRLPRKIIVQPNTRIVDGKVELVEYDATLEGVIKSFVERGL